MAKMDGSEDHKAESQWVQLDYRGDRPGKISHHSAVLNSNIMFLYGGLKGIDNSPHLYGLNLDTLIW